MPSLRIWVLRLLIAPDPGSVNVTAANFPRTSQTLGPFLGRPGHCRAFLDARLRNQADRRREMILYWQVHWRLNSCGVSISRRVLPRI